MPVCARSILQPDGTLLLALDPAVTNLSACSYVVDTGGSNAWRELGALTPESASQIGLALGVFWAIAWGFNLMGKSFFSTNEREL